MSETTTTLPAEGGDTAPETTATPADQTAPETGSEQTPDPAQETPPEPDPDAEERTKAQKRIDRLTREKWEARRETAALSARLSEIERQQQATRDPNAPLSPQDFQRAVEQRATEQRQQETFNAQCDEVFDAGTKEFPDFEASLGNFRTLGGLSPALIEAAIETDAAAKVLHYLGKNLEEAETILKLSPARMGAAVAKLASKVSAAPPPKPVTKAPAPIKPLASTSTVSDDQEPKDPDAWTKWFNKQRDAHRKR